MKQIIDVSMHKAHNCPLCTLDSHIFASKTRAHTNSKCVSIRAFVVRNWFLFLAVHIVKMHLDIRKIINATNVAGGMCGCSVVLSLGLEKFWRNTVHHITMALKLIVIISENNI